jgi:hypothetical protein
LIEEIQMAKTHEEMLDIPGCKEIQIKTTLRFHLTHHQGHKGQQIIVRMWGKGTLILAAHTHC